MRHVSLLAAIFQRYGVPLREEEISGEVGHSPREAILTLLANREIAARFDGVHNRPPDETDVEELLDIYNALAARE